MLPRTKGTVRAVIYARYSSDLQRSASIDDQTRLCRQYIEGKGWQLTQVYADPEMTGRTAHRPEYQRLLRDAEGKRFDVVVTEAVDRLSRRLADLSDMYDNLRIADIRIVTPELGELEQMHIVVLGLVAELYSSQLAEKTKRGQVGRAGGGYIPGGLAYGYQALPPKMEGKKMVAGEREIIPEQAEIVLRIYREYADGKSPEAIVRDLNREGVPGPRRKPWYNTTLRGQGRRTAGILRNPIYVGRPEYGRASYVTHPKLGKRIVRLNDPEEVIAIDAPHLRIVDEVLWNRVQRRLREVNAKATSARRAVASDRPGTDIDLNATHRPGYLLSGLMRCSVCGAKYTMIGKDRYGCANRGRGTGMCSNSKTIIRQTVEGRVLAALQSRLLTPENVDHFVKTVTKEIEKRRDAAAKDERRLRKALAVARQAINNIMVEIEQGRSSPALYERLAEREAEKARIEERLADLEAKPPEIAMPENLPEIFAGKVGNLAEALNDPQEKDAAMTILRDLIDKVVMIPDPCAPNGMALEVHGAMAEMLALGDGGGKEGRKGRRPAELAGHQASVVAGAGFEPAAFRL